MFDCTLIKGMLGLNLCLIRRMTYNRNMFAAGTYLFCSLPLQLIDCVLVFFDVSLLVPKLPIIDQTYTNNITRGFTNLYKHFSIFQYHLMGLFDVLLSLTLQQRRYFELCTSIRILKI